MRGSTRSFGFETGVEAILLNRPDAFLTRWFRRHRPSAALMGKEDPGRFPSDLA
jgi:hypothetical protein